ncbi:hypothetical protein B4Q13_15500 [Lacticaseibacillus rhamnosus]
MRRSPFSQHSPLAKAEKSTDSAQPLRASRARDYGGNHVKTDVADGLGDLGRRGMPARVGDEDSHGDLPDVVHLILLITVLVGAGHKELDIGSQTPTLS